MSLRRFQSLQDVRVDDGVVNSMLVDGGYGRSKRYSWGLISSLVTQYRSTENMKLLGCYRAIPEEGTHHGRRQSNSRSVYESPRESISRRTCQSEFLHLVGYSDEVGAISREERARMIRERFESDRQRRLEQLKEARRQADMFREQQLMLKKRRLEESRARDFERRRSVEERRKKLEEIEQIRRECLQRKLERIERNNEARRNAGGPSGARIFGFGSCTPREIYLSYPRYIAKNGFTVVNPYPMEKDKMDRTVSTPNIAASNQKVRMRRSESGILSQMNSLERSRRPSATRNMAERPRPASALGHPRSEPTPRRAGSSLGVSSPSPSASSGFFDRLSQPRRVNTRSEEAAPERKRNFVSTTPSSTAGTIKSCLSSSKHSKSASRKTLKTASGDNTSNASLKPVAVTFREDHSDAAGSDEPDHLSVVVNVEDVEADALNDVDSEVDTESSRAQVTATEEEEEEDSESLPNDTSAAVTSLPTDRSASPPKTLQLSEEATKAPPTIAVIHTSPTKSEPGGRSRPSTLRPSPDGGDGGRKHPSTNALPPPSPPTVMNKGSAPSTPTGQREMPRASSTREVTEEEYKQRLAEQRRLARERMAAQEAEKARAREEEKKRREEELQRLREAAEQQRREEEEEEKRRAEEARQEEEQKRRQEEEEREEAERKEREEQEQRQQLLERERQAQLKLEEEKRLERKKRLESIMSRVKKTGDTSGSRESLTSSHLDLSSASNGSETILETERPVSPAPQFKSALLQSMLSKGRLSTSIRAVSALRRSQGHNGSAGSLISDLQNLSRSSENLSSTSNSGPTMPTSSSGEMTTSQIENQLSPPPVVNPCMWRSHPNGIPGLGGHERDDEEEPSENYEDEDEEVDSNPALIANSIQSRLTERHSAGKPSLAQETRRSRPNSVHFEDRVPISHGGTDRGDIVDDESTSSDADTQLMTHNTVSDQWLAEEPHLSTSMAPRSMADMMS